MGHLYLVMKGAIVRKQFDHPIRPLGLGFRTRRLSLSTVVGNRADAPDGRIELRGERGSGAVAEIRDSETGSSTGWCVGRSAA